MNIRILAFTCMSALLATNIHSMQAVSLAPHIHTSMETGRALVAGACQELEKTGKEIIKTLPTKIDLEFSPRSLWTSILSVTSAVLIYKGFTQLLSTWNKPDTKSPEEKQNREKSYKIGAAKIIAGLISLGGSYAVWQLK